SMPRSLISFSTSLRAPGSDVALFLLSTCAIGSSSLDRTCRSLRRSAELPSRDGRAVTRAARRSRVPAPGRCLRRLDRTARVGRLVLAAPGGAPLRRRLGGAGELLDSRQWRAEARLRGRADAGLHR